MKTLAVVALLVLGGPIVLWYATYAFTIRACHPQL